LVSTPALAATSIKFATLAPEGSTWMKVMRDLDAELQEKTGGQLKFKMYPGGISGDEKDVVKKVRIGQLHAAGFTGVGLGEIAPDVRILDAPWLFRDVSEADYIYKKFDKELTGAIEKAGYVLLGWTELGRVYVFSKDPIDGIESMKRAKMWVWEGDPIAQAAYKAIGVSPIPLSVVDVMSSLQSGLIDAVYGPPMGVVALQWFTKCRHIYSLPIADAAGAVLLSKKIFDELPADQRKVLREASAKHLRALTLLSRRENETALDSLRKQGLKMSAKPSPETMQLYRDLGRSARRELAGKLYSAELLEKVEKALEDLRGGKATTSGKAKKS
jgi:TRAP-type C4-dicarboxylate transport system substrate-binding protein